MAHHKVICLKHRCFANIFKCDTPLHINVGDRVRIPPKNNINRWKEFIDWYNERAKNNHTDFSSGLKKLPIDKDKVLKFW